MAALIDTHVHLAREEFAADREAARQRAHDAGVQGLVHVGFDRASNAAAQELAEGDPHGWATAGLHPHDALHYDHDIEGEIRRLGEAGKILAVGECGLDFFRDLSPRPAQAEAFRRQIALAKDLDLPLVFHVRDAYPEVRELLLAVGFPPRRGVFHAFAADAEFARWAVGEGFKLGIGGPLTYRNSRLPDAIAGLPAASFLLETDAPWLPPQPWRGKRNEPAYLRETAVKLAALLEIDLDRLSQTLAGSFEALFSVTLPDTLRGASPSTHPAPEAGKSRKSL
jgi:TatD DNase family protein